MATVLEEMEIWVERLMAEAQEVRGQRDALAGALEALVNRYMMNRGSKTTGEFIACITPPHRCDAKPGDPHWAEWDAAVAALRKAGR